MNENTAQAQSTKSNTKSLAAQLTTRWQAKLLAMFFRLNVFLCVLAAVGIFWLWESRIAEGYSIYNQDHTTTIAHLQMQRTAVPPDGYQVPQFLRGLLPQATRDGWRSFGVTPSQEEPSFWNFGSHMSGVMYQVTIRQQNAYLMIAYPIGRWLQIAIWVLIILLLYESFIWFGNIRQSRRMAAKLLRPLADLAQITGNLQEQAGIIGGIPKGPQAAQRPYTPPGGIRDEHALKALAGTIQQIDADRLGTRLRVDSAQRELQELAVAINAMLERINESYRSQARFVQDASHELRTPISVIQGYANLLSRWGKEDAKTLEEAIDAIKSESDRMKTLIDDLLFLARSDNDTQELAVTTVDITALLNEVYKETCMIDKTHTWTLGDMPPTVPITADPVLIKQAVRILVDNAIKYSPSGEDIALSLNLKEALACISVQDSGIGIAPDELAHIFDRFYRADTSRSRKTGGTGLGLAIAKWIAEKHGGHFEVLSRVNVGTRMTLCLPITAAPVAALPETALPPQGEEAEGIQNSAVS